MRLIRSPLRISIGGGGTDLPFYYRENKADLTFASINRYLYITTHSRLDEKYRILFENHREEAANLENISHKYVKTALKTLNVEKTGLSISSSSEIPSGTGLGSSGSFTVALLKALEPRSEKTLNPKDLAETAFEMEHNELGKPCGKQDQYAAAFGGLKRLQIDEDGKTSIEKLDLDTESRKRLDERLMLFYTQERRYSEKVLDKQRDEIEENYSKKKKMDEIKKIGEEIRKALENRDISKYGKLLHKHWETKKKFTAEMTNPKIDSMYSDAIKNGAVGGKIVGAGGGGFLMLFVEEDKQDSVKNAMKNHNAKHMEFKLESRGCEVIYEG